MPESRRSREAPTPRSSSAPPAEEAPQPLRRVESLPGPRGLPLIGVAAQLDPERFHAHLEQWYQEFGGTYTFKLGSQRFVVFGELDEARDLLQRRPAEFRRSEYMARIIDELGGHGVFSAEGETWRRMRKLTTPGFNQAQLRHFFPQLQVISDRLYGVLGRASEGGGAWDFRGDFERFTTDVTTCIAFGHDVNSLEGGRDLLQADVEQVLPAVNRRMAAAFPLWRYVKLPKERRVEAAAARLREKIEGIIGEARARVLSDPEGVDPDRAQTLLDAMIAASLSDEEGERLSNQELYGNTLTLLLAGEDTTAHTLAWVAHALVSEAGVQEAIYEELERVLGEREGNIELAEVSRLPYLSGVIQEVLRLRSVAPIMFHQPYASTQLGSVQLEAEHVVVVLTRHCATQGEHFSEAERFMPERWIRSESSQRARCPVHNAKAMMAFGGGPRVCPGRGLSLLEMTVALARLCRSFRVEAISDPAQVREIFAITMSPRDLELRLVRR